VDGSARFVALWWDARTIPDRHDVNLTNELRGIPAASGVYAICGRHDAHASPGVLYIGRATRRPLSKRILESVEDCLSEKHDGDQRALFSDVWDLTIRWARLRYGLTASVEKLLIMSHSPPFNSQAVRRAIVEDDEHDLVIMNAGRKGPLLSVVAGAYQAEGWRNVSGVVGP
jgi:hypothetical protein